jgi:hypothetical protein
MSDYEHDFYAWTQTQAEALRAKDVAALDLEHLAEEIESLGINAEHAIADAEARQQRPVLVSDDEDSQC